MKFKVDENLPVEIADLLKSANYDALTVMDQGLTSADDDKIIDVCSNEDRVLVTLDLDFANVCAYPPEQYAGIMVIRVGIQEKYHIINTFKQAVPLIKQEMIKKQLWIIEETMVRIHE